MSRPVWVISDGDILTCLRQDVRLRQLALAHLVLLSLVQEGPSDEPPQS